MNQRPQNNQQRPQQQPTPAPATDSFAVLFERVPTGGFRVTVAITDDGKRAVHHPRGCPDVCNALVANTEIDNMRERLEDWIVGKYSADDDRTLEAKK